MKKKSSSRYLKWGGILIVLLNLLLANAILHKTYPDSRPKISGTASENEQDAAMLKQQAAAGQQASDNPQATAGQQASDNPQATAGQQATTDQRTTAKQQTLASLRSKNAGDILDASLLTQEMVDNLFYHEDISEEIKKRIWNCSYRENRHISLSDLQYVRVLYLGFDGKTHIGELIVNKAIAKDILEIMAELYANDYPIEKMVLIDEYMADDDASMEDNNTSAFNYRVIAGTNRLSMHGLGLAIDINPQYNPYVSTTSAGTLHVSPENGTKYADRNADFPHKLDKNDLCCQLFLQHGFTWGGDWNSVKDYQHFEKKT